MKLKQSTTVNVKLGPFVDRTDGYTNESGLTPTIKLSKNGAALAARNSATATAYDADGYYTVELNATDTNTLGRLKVTATDTATHLHVLEHFDVISPAWYDEEYASPLLLQAGAASTATLAAGASAVDNYYNGDLLYLESGTGSGQTRRIVAYVGSTKVATLDTAWLTTPTSSTAYRIIANGSAHNLSAVKRNTALTAFEFLMTNATTHAPATGLTVSVTRSIDGAAFAAGSLSAVTEVAFGLYKVTFAAADMNGVIIMLRATATGCDDTFERILTEP